MSYNQYDAYNRRPGYNNNQNGQFYGAPPSTAVSVASFANAPITFIATSTKNFMQRHYIMTMLWAIGLLIVSLARGYTVDHETEIIFSDALYEADKIEQNQLNEAYLNQESKYQRYYRSKGWFSCDAYCQSNYQDYLRAKEQVNDAKVCQL